MTGSTGQPRDFLVTCVRQAAAMLTRALVVLACATQAVQAQTNAFLGTLDGSGRIEVGAVPAPTHMMCCDGTSTQCGTSGAAVMAAWNDMEGTGGIRLPPINLATTGAGALLLVNSDGNKVPSADAEGLCRLLLDMTNTGGSPCVAANWGPNAAAYGINPLAGASPVSDWGSMLSVQALGGMVGVDPCDAATAAARQPFTGVCSSQPGSPFAAQTYNIALDGVCLDGVLPAGSASTPGVLWMAKAASIQIVDPQEIGELPNIAWAKLLNIRAFGVSSQLLLACCHRRLLAGAAGPQVSNSVKVACAADGSNKLMHDGVPNNVDIGQALDQVQV